MDRTLEDIGAAISDAKLIQVKAETELKALLDQYQEKAQELKALGINPETATQDLKALQDDFEKKKKELEALIPFDIIAQYKNK